MGPDPKLPENPLAISWHDSNWIPVLTPHNVMDYFSERSNPFYDRTCNNEVLKMQRASPEQLQNMQGVEFCLLHVQDPILYVVRKQHRHSPTQVLCTLCMLHAAGMTYMILLPPLPPPQVTPIADYYIIAGTVYQAPDLGSVLNSRLISTVNHLQAAFEEARYYGKQLGIQSTWSNRCWFFFPLLLHYRQYSAYHPSRGYWWDFDKNKKKPSSAAFPAEERALEGRKDRRRRRRRKGKKVAEKRKAQEEPSSIFQRRRVDILLNLLTRKFPPKVPAGLEAGAAASGAATRGDGKEGEGVSAKAEKEVKVEPTVQPPASSSSGIKREAPSSGGLMPNSKKAKTG